MSASDIRAEEVSATVWRILRESYLRRYATGPRSPAQMTEAEAQHALDPHMRALAHDHRLLVELVGQAFLQGVEHVHGLLHSRPGVDNAMLDQAAEYAAHAKWGQDADE